MLLQNEVPKEQEEVDDQQQMELRDDLCCPTKKPKEMVVMIVDRGRVMMREGRGGSFGFDKRTSKMR